MAIPAPPLTRAQMLLYPVKKGLRRIGDMAHELFLRLRLSVRTDRETLKELGRLLERRSDWKNAAFCYRQVLEKSPDDFDTSAKLGKALCNSGEVEASIPILRRAVEMKPDHVQALTTLGRAYFETGDDDAAFASIIEAMRLDSVQPPSPWTEASWLFKQIVQRRSKRDRKRDVERFQQEVERNPEDHEALLQLGFALFSDQQVESSLRAYRKSLESKPDCALAHYRLARALEESGDHDEAKRHYAEASRLDPSRGYYRSRHQPHVS